MKTKLTSFVFYFRLEVKSAYERTFHSTGLYYFCLENYDTDWVEDEVTLICVIKVTQMNRYIVIAIPLIPSPITHLSPHP